MKHVTQSLQIFGLYAFLTGITFIVYPGVFTVLQLPELSAGWTRLIGLLAAVVGIYYIVNAAYLPFAKASVVVRLMFAVGVFLLFITKQLPFSILNFGFVDIIGAIWTYTTLKKGDRT